MTENKKTGKNFWLSATVMLALAAMMLPAVIVFQAAPHLPMLAGCCIAAVSALLQGKKWNDIEKSLISGVSQGIVSLIILLLIGVLMGVWILSGVVPTLIYYGLKTLRPAEFLPVTMLVCALISMIMGSWGTIGTIGLAMMGIAAAMGISPAIAAGAVISGAYVGDKISPLSDTVNLASAVTGVPVYKAAFRNYFIPLGALIVAGIAFFFIGRGHAAGVELSQLDDLTQALENTFIIRPYNLIPLALLVICTAIHLPTIPCLCIGIAAGALQAMLLQGADLGYVMMAGMEGCPGNTGAEVLDKLLSAGGLSSMMYSVSMIICAMAFGGIMQGTGQMDALLSPLVTRIKKRGSLLFTTMLTCLCVNLFLPEQYISIAVPGSMFRQEYHRRGICPDDLAFIIGAGGSATSVLVPWNTCGVFVSGILNISTIQYFPFAFYNFLLPVLAVLWGFLYGRTNRDLSVHSTAES